MLLSTIRTRAISACPAAHSSRLYTPSFEPLRRARPSTPDEAGEIALPISHQVPNFRPTCRIEAQHYSIVRFIGPAYAPFLVQLEPEAVRDTISQPVEFCSKCIEIFPI
jgi:hypothetical protein